MTTLNDGQIDICKKIKQLNHCNEKEKQDRNAVSNLYMLFIDKTRQGLTRRQNFESSILI